MADNHTIYKNGAKEIAHLNGCSITFMAKPVARAALGDDVVDHHLNYARTEQRLFDEVVTWYERERTFERG